MTYHIHGLPTLTKLDRLSSSKWASKNPLKNFDIIILISGLPQYRTPGTILISKPPYG